MFKWLQDWTRELIGDGNQQIPMVTHLSNQISGASVRFLTLAAMVRVRTQHEARFTACLIYCLGTVFVKQCFGRERAEWMVCHLDRVSSSEATTCNHQFSSLSDEGSSPKESGCTIWQVYQYLKLCLPPVLHCTISVVVHYLALQHQYRIVTCAALMKYFVG